MPDSSITKQAFAAALKALMQEMPFEKVSVSHICQKCNMNRQSFYYHFQDKYELLNWIFDMAFIGRIEPETQEQSMQELTALFGILYNDRTFYRNALSVWGQNSLIEHIRDIAIPVLRERMREALPDENDQDFYLDFFLDALLGAIMRWIMDENCEPPEKFLPHFFSCLFATTKYIYKKYITE